MAKINEYMNDGACKQARAVLCFLNDSIESSWNDNTKQYDCRQDVARWENCREQGYVVSLRSKGLNRQLNIAFFEHRNSDSICMIRWEQLSINSIGIDNAIFGDIYKDKWDISASFPYGEITAASDWINEQMDGWYEESSKEFYTQKEVVQ